MPLIIVDGDPVTGTDTHNVSGNAVDTSSGATVPWAGTGRYAYTGSMASALSGFVRIGGSAVAVSTSTSALDAGEDAGPTGGHSGPAGTQLAPGSAQPTTASVPIPASLAITDPIGTGTPGTGAGSGFVRIDGDPLLLDQDPIDTCDGAGNTGNSSVRAQGQDFVMASA